MVNRIQFRHEELREVIRRLRRKSRMSLKDAGDFCGIESKRFASLERDAAGTMTKPVKFTAPEIISICFFYNLDLWEFVIKPETEAGSISERRDLAIASAQLSWQITAELKILLKNSIERGLTEEEKIRAARLFRTAGAN